MHSRGENLYYFTIGFLGIGVLIFANILLSNRINETFGLFIILTLLGLIIQKFGEIKIEDLIITLDTSVMFACYFLMGIVTTLWLNIFVVGIYGILFESKPKRKVFNNAGMFTLIYFIAHYIFMAMKQSLMASVLVNVYVNVTFFGLLVFILNWCFMMLQIIITIGSFPKWLNESLKWDFYTNIVVIPLAILLINSYNNYGYFGIILISILVFVVILFFRLIRNLVFMNNELRVVYEVSATISSKLDLNETIASILKGIEELVFSDFSIINDTYGHQTGDKVLKEIAKILKNNVRNNDQVYRYGGEEFAILLPNTNEEQAKYIANRIRKAVENNNFVGLHGESIKITISGGISSFPQKATSGSVLLSHADRAMYTGAKQKGRNKVCIYGN